MKRLRIPLIIFGIIGLILFSTFNLLVKADTRSIEAELGGYDNIRGLSEVILGDKKVDIFTILEKNSLEELEKEGIEIAKNGESNHNIYILKYNNIEIGDILINDYVTSLNIDKAMILGGINLNDSICRKELEKILKYDINNKETWIGTLDNGKTSFDWNVELGDETEDSSLGIIYNENELQIDEYRIRYGFDRDGKVIALQFNWFHGKESLEI